MAEGAGAVVAVVSGDRGFTVVLVVVAVLVGLAAFAVLIPYLGLAPALFAGAFVGLAYRAARVGLADALGRRAVRPWWRRWLGAAYG